MKTRELPKAIVLMQIDKGAISLQQYQSNFVDEKIFPNLNAQNVLYAIFNKELDEWEAMRECAKMELGNLNSFFELAQSAQSDETDGTRIKRWLHISEQMVDWLHGIGDQYNIHPKSAGMQVAPELPSELDNDRIRNCFARAIKLGFMEKTDRGYKWLRPQIQLGYFCSKLFEQPRPINKIEELFGVKKLASSITQAEFEPKRADVKKWRTEIDENIFH